MKFRQLLQVVIAVLCVWANQAANAATANANFTVSIISHYDDVDGDGVREFGGCLVKVTPDPRSVLGTCKSKYVAPSCDGTHSIDKRTGQAIMDTITIAAMTGRTIKLGLDDSKRHSNYCFVNYAQLVY